MFHNRQESSQHGLLLTPLITTGFATSILVSFEHEKSWPHHVKLMGDQSLGYCAG